MNRNDPPLCAACIKDPDPRGGSACADCRAIAAREGFYMHGLYVDVDPNQHSHRNCCAKCWRDRREHRRATVRAFSGQYAGDGWPGCAEHATWAITEAMRPLVEFSKMIDYSKWRVSCHRIEDDNGWPVVRGVLFIARRKVA